MKQSKIKVFVSTVKSLGITSMYPSGKIFTLIEKEDKLFKKQEVIYNKVGELVDRKDLSCINQGLIKQNKLKDEVSSLLI